MHVAYARMPSHIQTLVSALGEREYTARLKDLHRRRTGREGGWS
jgi:hypothetical protein